MYTWGIFLAYMRRHNVSVSLGSGRYSNDGESVYGGDGKRSIGGSSERGVVVTVKVMLKKMAKLTLE